MSVHDVPRALSSPPVPRPRRAEGVDVRPATEAMQTGTVAGPPLHISWVEPGHRTAGGRPSTEYWDVTTASWHCPGPQRD